MKEFFKIVIPAIALTLSATSTFANSVDEGDRNASAVQEVKEEAKVFLKSGGVIRGANLQKAIEHVKSSNPQDESSDTTIATRILYN